MTDLTGINIFDHILGSYKEKGRTGEFFGSCPFCNDGEDRFLIWNNPGNGANPSYWCRRCDEKGDVWQYLVKHDGLTVSEAGDKLGVSRENGSTPPTSKRGYKDGQDYADQHGLDMVDLTKSGWEEVEHKARPALKFKTKGGMRWRFLDGDKPAYISEYGFTRSWFGLSDKVIQQAKNLNSPLIFCNGEISTIAARFWDVPAITVAGGGEKEIPETLLTELLQRWDGQIAIALDCDDTGRKNSQKIQAQLGDRGVVIDLGLLDGQDLADYVKLHGSSSLRNLKRLIPVSVNAPMSSREAARLTTERLDINNVMVGKPFIMPYQIYHRFGGYARICYPKKLTGAVAMSGHGKTSWLNTGADTLIKRGENGVGIMPEFEGDEYQWDRLQRYSGQNGMPHITATMMMEWELWKWENKEGIPRDERMGYELSRDEQRAVTHINNMVESWKGEFTLFSMGAGIEDSFLEMGDYINSHRAMGEVISFGSFDYIQILKSNEVSNDDNSHEHVLGLIKQFCMDFNIHGFVSSQVNKTADKSARSQNKILESSDMRYVRDDKINCLITLNPLYDGATGEMIKVTGTNCYATIANIAKNNKGKKGRINQMADFEHLTWLDQTYSTESIVLDDETVDLSNL